MFVDYFLQRKKTWKFPINRLNSPCVGVSCQSGNKERSLINMLNSFIKKIYKATLVSKIDQNHGGSDDGSGLFTG